MQSCRFHCTTVLMLLTKLHKGTTEESRFDSQQGQHSFPRQNSPRQLLGPPIFVLNGYRVFSDSPSSSVEVKISGAIPPFVRIVT
jgi:hypothetical protein